MNKKEKFKPEITKVELNPEQAVLACSCYDNGTQAGFGFAWPTTACALFRGKSHIWIPHYNSSSASS